MLGQQQLKLDSAELTEIEIKSSEQSRAAAEAQMAEISKDIADIEKQLEQASQGRLEESQRVYETHIKSKENSAKLRKQIESLSTEVANLEVIEARGSSLASQQQVLRMAYSEDKGVLQQLSSRLKELCQHLSDPAYKQIEMKRADLAIQYNLTIAQISEWNAEHDALEAGLMQYHHDKMTEINR